MEPIKPQITASEMSKIRWSRMSPAERSAFMSRAARIRWARYKKRRRRKKPLTS